MTLYHSTRGYLSAKPVLFSKDQIWFHACRLNTGLLEIEFRKLFAFQRVLTAQTGSQSIKAIPPNAKQVMNII